MERLRSRYFKDKRIIERTVGAALRGRPRLNGACDYRSDQIEGGHGGPPLQYVRQMIIFPAYIFTIRLLGLSIHPPLAGLLKALPIPTREASH